MTDSTTSNLTPSDRQLLTESYQRAKERHERRNELLMDMEGENIVRHYGKWKFQFRDPCAECLRTEKQ